MSRKSRAKSDRSPDAWSKAAKRGAGTAAAGSQPSIGWTILFAALALVVSAVFFAQLIRPDGFLAAITQADLARLERNRDAGISPNRDTLLASLREELRRTPTTRRHEAVARLLTKLIDVQRGKADAASAALEADALLAEDADNLLSRVARAVIGDAQAATPEPNAETATTDALLTRFRALEQIVVGGQPTEASRLYNKEFDETWFAVLRNGVSRYDVAANLSKYIRHYEIREHYAALPVIQHRLTALAEKLDAAGHRDEARGVRRWLVQLFVGLMRSESDPGTRLLCADMLGRTLAGSEPQLAERMAALRDEYHSVSDAAPVDLTDPERSPAVNPARYRSMTNLFVLALFLAMIGIGAAAMFILSASAGFVSLLWGALARPTRNDNEAPAILKPMLARLVIAVAGFAVLLAALILCWPLKNAAMYSEGWGYRAMILACAAGAILVLLRSDLVTTVFTDATSPEKARQTRPLVVLFLTFLPVAMLVIPPAWLEWAMRWIDLKASSVIVLGVLMVVMIAIAYRRVRSSARIITTTAATTWLMAIMLAYTSLLVHESFAWHAYGTDELTMRLGADWQARFLTDIAKAYDIPAS